MTHTTEQLEQMLAAATPGPWGFNTRRMFGPISDADDQSFGMVLDIGECDFHSGKGEANATLVAAAPTIAAELIAARKRIAEIEDALHEARRAIGDHHAPSDCYASGPLTGDSYRDLVQCPACTFIALHDAAMEVSK